MLRYVLVNNSTLLTIIDSGDEPCTVRCCCIQSPVSFSLP